MIGMKSIYDSSQIPPTFETSTFLDAMFDDMSQTRGTPLGGSGTNPNSTPDGAENLLTYFSLPKVLFAFKDEA